MTFFSFETVGVVVVWGLVAWIGLTLALWLWNFATRPRIQYTGQHCVITGGSSGLGLALAEKLVAQGANVTLVARNQARLDSALKTIQAAAISPSQTLRAISADVTKYESIEAAIAQSTKDNQGRAVDFLVCNAGAAKPGYFMEQDVSAHRFQMELNYLGCVHAVRAAADGMARRRSGKIVLVGSACSLTTFIGYSSYGSSKYAVRALGEALRNEFHLYGIGVHTFLPCSMDTPGFVEENKLKPPETKLIEDGGGLSTPEQSANNLLSGLRSGKFAITEGFDQWLLRVSTSGVAMRQNAWLEALVSPIATLATAAFRVYFDHVVKPRNYPHNKTSESQ